MKKFNEEDLRWYHKFGMVVFLVITAPYWIVKELIKLSKTTL